MELLTKKKSASSGLNDTRWRMRKHSWPTERERRRETTGDGQQRPFCFEREQGWVQLIFFFFLKKRHKTAECMLIVPVKSEGTKYFFLSRSGARDLWALSTMICSGKKKTQKKNNPFNSLLLLTK